MRTRSSSARDGRASRTRAITASTAGIPAIYPTFPRWLDCRPLSCSFSAVPASRSGRDKTIGTMETRDRGQTAVPQIWASDQFRKWLLLTPSSAVIQGTPAQEEIMLLRGGRCEEANLFLGLRRSS
jgi:hypothetical protein